MNIKGALIVCLGLVFIGAPAFAQYVQYSENDRAFLDLRKKEEVVLAFGSCSKHDLEQPLWREIVKNRPDLWIWLGDIVYGDSEDMEVIRNKYRKQFGNSEYLKLRTACPVFGTWDDHDYGVNDGGKDYPKKEESKKLLLDFLQVDLKNNVWDHPGVYQAYDLLLNSGKVRIILLDTRTFRDPLKKANGQNAPDPNGDILGEAQWTWLEKQLEKSTGLTIIVSSIQVLPEEHPYEKWANFPTARQRLLDLLKNKTNGQVVLISGDRHMGELSALEQTDHTFLREITTSGLTHIWENKPAEPNKYRLPGNASVHQLNYGLLRYRPDTNTVTLEIRGEGDEPLRQITFQF